MKKRKILLTIIILFIGIVIGFILLLFFGAIMSYIDPGTELNKPKKFGDVKIWTVEVASIENRETYDLSKTMVMTKDNFPFAEVAMDKAGKVKAFTLLGKPGEILFTMTASTEPGKWEYAIYAGGDDYPTGEGFTDINVDGHFDVKTIYDDTGKRLSREIYVDRTWKQIDHWDPNQAKSGETTYVFDEESGWQVLNNEE